MLPKFPEFKKIDIQDREAVEVYTSKYPPYSDFNFPSLGAWDTAGERMLSVLNDNLVVRFTDYSTMEPFLSFLGDNECERTALELLQYSKENGLPSQLRLIPEISIKDIDPSVLRIEEDRDNFDYLYSVADLTALKGANYESIRRSINTFKRNNPVVHTETKNCMDASTQSDILSVIDMWEKNKIARRQEYEIAHELESIRKLCASSTDYNLYVIELFIDAKPKGFMIAEMLSGGYAMSHFIKADINIKGIFDFLFHENASYLQTKNVTSLNFEQDLGLAGLRQNKMSYVPQFCLKKYVVSEV